MKINNKLLALLKKHGFLWCKNQSTDRVEPECIAGIYPAANGFTVVYKNSVLKYSTAIVLDIELPPSGDLEKHWIRVHWDSITDERHKHAPNGLPPQLTPHQFGRLALYVDVAVRTYPEVAPKTEEHIKAVEANGGMELWELHLAQLVNKDPLLPDYNELREIHGYVLEYLVGYFGAGASN